MCKTSLAEHRGPGLLARMIPKRSPRKIPGRFVGEKRDKRPGDGTIKKKIQGEFS